MIFAHAHHDQAPAFGAVPLHCRGTADSLELTALAKLAAGRRIADALLAGHLGPDPTWAEGVAALATAAANDFRLAEVARTVEQ